MFLIGETILHITKCISDIIMALLVGLGTVTENRALPAFYNKSDFALPKFGGF
jgi:hypothetical protein